MTRRLCQELGQVLGQVLDEAVELTGYYKFFRDSLYPGLAGYIYAYDAANTLIATQNLSLSY